MEDKKIIKDICTFYNKKVLELKDGFAVISFTAKSEGDFKIYNKEEEFFREYYDNLVKDDYVGWEKELDYIHNKLAIKTGVECVEAVIRYKKMLSEDKKINIPLDTNNLNEVNSFIKKYCKVVTELPIGMTRKDKILLSKYGDICKLSTGEYFLIKYLELV